MNECTDESEREQKNNPEEGHFVVTQAIFNFPVWLILSVAVEVLKAASRGEKESCLFFCLYH